MARSCGRYTIAGGAVGRGPRESVAKNVKEVLVAGESMKVPRDITAYWDVSDRNIGRADTNAARYHGNGGLIYCLSIATNLYRGRTVVELLGIYRCTVRGSH